MAAESGWLFAHLSGVDYPISREDLVRLAEERGAQTETLNALRSLPMASFDSYDELTDVVDQLDQT